ncbi:uncharacterized protein LOC132753410 [Ruditapes philippinarum]|uniref:uncharacterized protein LOC132753410 n=1 Tax=Ruditapes philippinarum TaxID=129788 RepID=UPI00295BC741|nr:uncharacterized protein LOC132753410 [Ruditapes philippinarum]
MIPSQRSDSCNKSCPYYSEGQSNMLKVDDTCSCNYDTIIIVTVFIMAVVTVFIGLVAWWQIRNKNRKDKVADDSVLDSIDTDDGDTAESSFIPLNDRSPELPPDLPRPAL